MDISGSICFKISDTHKKLNDIDYKLGFNSSKLVIKGTPITSNKLALKNVWIYNAKFKNSTDFDTVLFDFIILLKSRKDVINKLKSQYENIDITIYIRSDYGQIGFTVNKQFIHELSKLDIDLSINILSFGMVESD